MKVAFRNFHVIPSLTVGVLLFMCPAGQYLTGTGVGSSQPQFAFQIVQLSELTAGDGGFALADCGPIVLAERFGRIVNEELQEPVGNQQFVVRKQFYKLVKSFFSAHKWILAPGSRGYGAARAMGHEAAVALTFDCFIASLTAGVLYGGRAESGDWRNAVLQCDYPVGEIGHGVPRHLADGLCHTGS